ncbi:MAG: type I restriction endonuclease subunit R [Cyanobacteria bacterium P01_G01_bin.54]
MELVVADAGGGRGDGGFEAGGVGWCDVLPLRGKRYNSANVYDDALAVMPVTAITKAITTLQAAEQRFNLVRTADPAFFSEWYTDLPEITAAATATLDRIRARYRYHRAQGHLAESLVNLVVLSPLLELAGFYDPPFVMRGEAAVELELTRRMNETTAETLRGRIDFLVISRGLWVAVLESKGTEINVDVALPQVLAYMMTSPEPQRPRFGLVTNGGEFFFVKVMGVETPQYDVSRVFSHLPLRNELYEVLRILQQIGGRFLE